MACPGAATLTHMTDAAGHALVAAPDPLQAPPLRWGVLGAGGIAAKFATEVPAFSSGDVVAVGSRDLAKARAFADRHGIAAAYGSYDELVAAPEVDAIYVATPHSHHHEHAILALEAGKPVLVEKAFTRNRAEAQEVLDLAGERGLFAMEAMWSRFLPHTVALRSLIESGALGEILLVEADHGQRLEGVQRLLDPVLAGGALLDLGVYTLSFIQGILGAPATIDARGTLLDTGVDAQEVVTLTYGDSRALAVSTSSFLARSHTRATVAGRDGRVDVTGPFYRPTTFTFTPLDGEPWTWSSPERPAPRAGREVAAAVEGGFQYQAAEAARCISAGRLESEAHPWQATLDIMATMDEVRRQLGVVYPGEQPA